MADRNSRVVLYGSIGETLTRYEVDVENATLARRESVALPTHVQYVWPHPSKRWLYVISSDRLPGSHGTKGSRHFAHAFSIGADGALTPHGEPQALASRSLHVCVDSAGAHLLTAYNDPSGIAVHRINADGTLGARIEQPAALDAGIFAHQVRVAPSGRSVVLVTRGNDAAGGRPEDPGALKLFRYSGGVLANAASVAPGGGMGFGPRHLDFHPSQPWVYVSIERQNQLQMYRMPDDRLESAPAFTKTLLAGPGSPRPQQLGGPVHVHPGGRFVYVSNRSDNFAEEGGRNVFAGGENSLAVFAIDPASGEPKLIQHADTHSIHIRTFSLDPSGRLLVGASIMPLSAREGGRLVDVPAALSVFRVGADGRLEFARKYDVETGGKLQFWSGMAGVPS